MSIVREDFKSKLKRWFEKLERKLDELEYYLMHIFFLSSMIAFGAFLHYRDGIFLVFAVYFILLAIYIKLSHLVFILSYQQN